MHDVVLCTTLHPGEKGIFADPFPPSGRDGASVKAPGMHLACNYPDSSLTTEDPLRQTVRLPQDARAASMAAADRRRYGRMENREQTTVTGFRPGTSPLGIWSLSIGASIGWGSFIVTCNAYLQKSGILGTVFGLLVGMSVILVITWNLQYMIQVSPDAGGVYSFQKKVSGKDLGFLALWFTLQTYMAVLWANITSVPLFARFFLGRLFQFGFHYSIFGYEVWFGEALLSICAVVLTGLLCAGSARLTRRILVAAALVFAAGFSLCAVFVLLRHDPSFSFAPMFAEGSSPFSQIVRIAAISPWAFIGFENVSHFSEEYTFPVKKIRGILLWSVVLTTLLYLFVSLLSISAYPPEYDSWMAYIEDMGNLEGIKAVPAFYAANHYLGQAGVALLMLALFGVILTSLIANTLALSRLLYAAGRDGEAPQVLSRLNSKGIPSKAILAIVAVSSLIPFLGRTAIGWIVDVTSLGATLIYGLVSFGVYRHARAAGHTRQARIGLLGCVLMVCFILLLLIPGLLSFDAMATESYVLFIVWSVLGLGYFRRLISRDSHEEYEHHVIVWVILLVLILFASMMWVSRATEQAANEAVERIYLYHQEHPNHAMADSEVERVRFLHEQARQISNTNMMYSMVSLSLFVLCFSIMLNNYRQTQKLGKRLTDAEAAARAAQKIAELKASLSALLNNMPGMNFSKDARTGVYLACNQAFADYAHKETPDGVIGLTDAQIFDAETTRHFIEDDRMALSMETPYIFFEDVLDATGNQKQFQTTKLKYTDDVGRLCILGMCQDVTEMVRIQRENATTKEAYEKARSTGIIFTHIAKTLARNYTNLYYVNTETGEFIEYRTDDESSMLTETRRGDNFFDECVKDAHRYVHPDDRDTFLRTMERQSLLQLLEQRHTHTLTYRLRSDHGPTYVAMKISRMDDDARMIVIGVASADEQMKQQRLAQRLKEERIAYARINALVGDFLCIYVVVPETGLFREYSSTERNPLLSMPKEGKDFFAVAREDAKKSVHPGDLARFLSLFTLEGVLAEIERSGIFTLSFRMSIGGKPLHVQLKAAIIEENDGRRLVVGINDIDSSVRQEKEYARRLAQVQTQAYYDALTGVRNRHAYLDAAAQLDQRLQENTPTAFAISILDVNNLKLINDAEGHQAGDQYLRKACKIICDIFSHSPVFRIGGDEFAVISQGDDYTHIQDLIEKVHQHNREALQTGGIVIACGMARFEGQSEVAQVFGRADQQMYENKTFLKSQSTQ